jgi:hypothetical protein
MKKNPKMCVILDFPYTVKIGALVLIDDRLIETVCIDKGSE